MAWLIFTVCFKKELAKRRKRKGKKEKDLPFKSEGKERMKSLYNFYFLFISSFFPSHSNSSIPEQVKITWTSRSPLRFLSLPFSTSFWSRVLFSHHLVNILLSFLRFCFLHDLLLLNLFCFSSSSFLILPLFLNFD
jgi:hypothetical protein